MAYHTQIPQYACSFGMTSAELDERSGQLELQHYRPVQVISYADVNGTRYAGIWSRDQRSALSKVVKSLTSGGYQAEFDALNDQGYRLLCVSAAASGGSLSYTGLWEDGGWKWLTARHGLSATDYQTTFDQLSADGYSVIWVNGHSTGSTSSYAAIWSRLADPHRHARHNLPIGDYQAAYDAYKADGYRIAHFNAHSVGSQTYVAAIWIKQDGYNPSARHNMTECEFKNELERNAWNDYRPICVSGYPYHGETRYAAIFVKNSRALVDQGRTGAGLEGFDAGIKQLMSTYGITAASLAVTRNGKLILARGFANVTDQDEPTTPTTLFRIASVSKAFTGTAVVKLIEDGKLRFTDTLLDLLGWQGAVKDPLLRQVTVDHLLHHFGGWDRESTAKDAVGDPMFQDTAIAADLNVPLPVTQESIFRWMTTLKTLDAAPGTQYFYSNYGYMLLGMIIERVTGMRYEDFVIANLLAPLGIRRMRLGNTQFQDRATGEGTYHSAHAGLYPNVMAEGAPADIMQVYGNYNFPNMAAHGSWIASAVDLVKFASSFDDPQACPLLNASSVQTLLTRGYPATPAQTGNYFSCGWNVNTGPPVETYRTGGFNGTDALVYRRSDGINAAVILNRQGREDLRLPCDADPPTAGDLQTPGAWPSLLSGVRGWIAGVSSWPSSVDMWSEFF